MKIKKIEFFTPEEKLPVVKVGHRHVQILIEDSEGMIRNSTYHDNGHGRFIFGSSPVVFWAYNK